MLLPSQTGVMCQIFGTQIYKHYYQSYDPEAPGTIFLQNVGTYSETTKRHVAEWPNLNIADV
jgi:hypothetical protein